MSARRRAVLAALRAVATECQALAASFSDEQASEVMSTTDELRALFQRPASTSLAVPELAAHPPELLSVVPPELLAIILSRLGTRDLACLAATCHSLWCDVPTPQSIPPPGQVETELLPLGLVETELRQRAEARGLHIGSSLPDGALSWVPFLLKRDFYNALRWEAPLAVGHRHSILVDRQGRLHLACRRAEIKAGEIGEPLVGHFCDSASNASTIYTPPTLVPSMQDKRIVSVATGGGFCLALSAVGEVYSWGDGADGVLSHADGSAGTGPWRIEMLDGVESIAAGQSTSAAVDDRRRLFTWGLATSSGQRPAGLGYEIDHPGTGCQVTPKRVDTLSPHRVVGVAVGLAFTLAVTDAGVVFSFGHSRYGALGHDSMESEVLPRRIEALAETGLQFVAVAAGNLHALALTDKGEVYGWGDSEANGLGQAQRTPKLVAKLAGKHVKLVYAQDNASCAVTEKGELYTWGGSTSYSCCNLCHGVATPQQTPKRVETLRHVKVTAVAICGIHTIVADAYGAAWGFGERSNFGVAATPPGGGVAQPTLIPNVRVRTLP